MKNISKRLYKPLQKFEQIFFSQIFVYLLVIVYFFGVMEFAVYPGFVKNYFYFGYQSYIYTAVILLTYFLLKKSKHVPKLLSNFFNVVFLTYIPLMFTYVVFYNLELNNYENYVFATHGVNFAALQDVIILSTSIIILRIIQSKQQLLFEHLRGLNLLQLLFVASVVFLVSINMITAAKRVFRGVQLSCAYRNLTYVEALTKSLGGNASMGWVVTYAEFIKQHTDASSYLIIPPQSDSWQMTGNAGYMNYFLYPRHLFRGKKEEFDIPSEATHILISHGLWSVGNDVGWPRMYIPMERIEKIDLIDRATLETTEVYDTDYNFDPVNYSQTWGIITLKKVE